MQGPARARRRNDGQADDRDTRVTNVRSLLANKSTRSGATDPDGGRVGARWEPLDEYQRVQQADLLPKLCEAVDHRARLYRHRVTGHVVVAAMPEATRRAGWLARPRALLETVGQDQHLDRVAALLAARTCPGIGSRESPDR